MPGEVKLSVRTELQKIIDDLSKLQKRAEDVGSTFKEIAKDTGDAVTDQTKRTETFFSQMQNFGRRVAGQLKSDFQSLLSINALGGALKLSEQFRGSIKETIGLSDTIRRLGATFGIAQKDFAGFQTAITKGLGDIGLSSEQAAAALQGLAETPVKGQKNLIEYSKTAAQLASISGEKGREGDIAKGLSSVVKAQGGNVNDLTQMKLVAAEVQKIREATGKGASETVKTLEDLLRSMPQDLRKAIGVQGLSKLAAAGTAGGPGSTKFLEELLSKSPIARKALEAQGFGNVFGKEGLNIESFKKAAGSVLKRVGMDPRMAAQTLGLTEEAAEGFVRLYESLDKVKDAQDRVVKSNGDVDKAYRETMGLGDSFRASINKVKSIFAAPLSKATQGITGMLGKASESNLGAAGVVAGGGLLAALLAGVGLKGIGKGLGVGGLAKGGAIEAMTGRQVQPVYVVNAGEIGGGMSEMLTAGGGLLSKLKTGGLYGGAALAGGAVGAGLSGGLDKLIESSGPDSALRRGSDEVTKLLGDIATKLGLLPEIVQSTKEQRVKIDLNKKDLKESRPHSRGASYGP